MTPTDRIHRQEEKHERPWYWLAFVAAILFALMALVGCDGVRLSQAQADQASQGRQDYVAAATLADKGDRSATPLKAAAADRFYAATANAELPPPRVEAVTLATSPEARKAECVEAKSEAANPPAGWDYLSLGTLAAAGVAAVVFAKKFKVGALVSLLPGVGPIVGPLLDAGANAAFDALATHKAHAVDKANIKAGEAFNAVQPAIPAVRALLALPEVKAATDPALLAKIEAATMVLSKEG